MSGRINLFALVALVAAIGAVFALVLIGVPSVRHAAAPAPAASEPDAPSVAVDGTKLSSVSIELPPDDATYPAGPDVDVVNAHCLACHSASMVLNQPQLSTDQWQKEVEKMHDTYRAPLTPADVAPIVAYLTTRQAPQQH